MKTKSDNVHMKAFYDVSIHRIEEEVNSFLLSIEYIDSKLVVSSGGTYTLTIFYKEV